MKRSVPSILCLLFVLSLLPALAQARPGLGRGRAFQDRPEPPEWEDADTDNDCLVSESEADAAIERMAAYRREVFEWRNEKILERFDADDDGKLTGDELEKARAAKEEIQTHIRERLGKRRELRGREG